MSGIFDKTVQDVGLSSEQAISLNHYGHIQSIDRILAIQPGLEQGKIKDGDLIVLAEQVIHGVRLL